MQLMDGKKISNDILSDIKKEIEGLPFVPVFCDILVGENAVSRQYVNLKMRSAERLGIRFHSAFFPEDITNEELLKEVAVLNNIPNMCGIIVQLPLPEHLDKKMILNAISPELDVDCLGDVCSSRFYGGDLSVVFPTALACLEALNSAPIDLANKNIVVLGQGELVGAPVSALLKHKGLDVIAVDSETKDKERLLKEADVIISGIGKGKFITGDILKQGVVLIDAGTSESGNAVVGDVDLESVKEVASYVFGVPGGVGPITVAMLFTNILKVAKTKINE